MNTMHPLHHLKPTHPNDLKNTVLKPFSWLKEGWLDQSYHPTASFGYGPCNMVCVSGFG